MLQLSSTACDTLYLAVPGPTSQPLRLVMQRDGNLVLYSGTDPQWTTHTDTGVPGTAVVQVDGNFVIYQRGRAVWSTGTCTQMMNGIGSTIGKLVAPALGAGQFITSPDGRAQLIMQTDGNLVLYRDHRALWATYAYGAANTAVLQGDGNFVVYDKAGRAVWNSHSDVAGLHPSLTPFKTWTTLSFTPADGLIMRQDFYGLDARNREVGVPERTVFSAP